MYLLQYKLCRYEMLSSKYHFRTGITGILVTGFNHVQVGNVEHVDLKAVALRQKTYLRLQSLLISIIDNNLINVL